MWRELQVILHRVDSSSENISAVGTGYVIHSTSLVATGPVLWYLWFLLEEQQQLIDVFRFQRTGYDLSLIHI